MKEYIAKDEIQQKLFKMLAPEIITKEEMTERGTGLYLSILTIDNSETVTKADICREFKTLDLLLDWALECDFGLDSFPEETEKYSHLFTDDMSYKDCMIKVAESVLAEMENEE